MTIDPDTQAVLDMVRLAGRPPFEALTPAEARQAYINSRRLLQNRLGVTSLAVGLLLGG